MVFSTECFDKRPVFICPISGKGKENGGIGFAHAKKFLAAGNRVIIVGRTEKTCGRRLV